MQPQINDFLKSLNSIQDTYKENDSELKILEEFIDKPLDKISKSEALNVDEASKLLSERHDKLSLEYKNHKQYRVKLYRRINFIYSMDKDMTRDTSAILDELGKEFDKYENVLEEYSGRVHKLATKVGKKVKTTNQQSPQ